MAQAIRLALHYAEEHLELKDIFGEDVGPPLGGVFTATQGLKTAWNSPLDERGIIGMATGIAMAGDRCVAEIQFVDYIFNTIDLLKIIGNTHWVTNGAYHLPLVVMTPVGAGIRGSIYHSHSFDGWATRLPGWKIIMPSNPKDAYGLLLAAIKDPNPVLYLKPKALLRVRGKDLIPGEPHSEVELKKRIDAPLGSRSQWKPNWPAVKKYEVKIGKGQLVQKGKEATIVTYGRHVLIAEEVIKKEGFSVDLIDMRSLYPYDWGLIKSSVQKTGRILFINEDTEVTNFAEHLAYRVTKECFYELLTSPRVLAAKNVPGIGLSPSLEENTVPQYKDINRELRALLESVP